MDRDPSNTWALDFGSFVDPSSVGPVAELLGPRWAKERKVFMTYVSQMGRESGFAWGRRTVHHDFWWERIGTASACPAP